MAKTGLSKSRIIAWKQCPKRLWLQINRTDLIQYSDSADQRIQTGNEVGVVAQGLFPDGILIDDESLSAAVERTRQVMSAFPDRPIFEATFESNGLLVRVDLMLPTPNGYRMIEVKSSTAVKDYHLDDCAVQSWVLIQNRVPLASIELAHVDTSFVYEGDGNYREMFKFVPITDRIAPLFEQVPAWVNAARRTLLEREPEIEPGEQCGSPFECPFQAYCNRHAEPVPELEFPLEILSGMRVAKKDEFRSRGIDDARMVDPELLTDKQKWIQRVSITGAPELLPGAKKALNALAYPRYYLDFETINFVVPRWSKTRPYGTQVTFQWSCHREERNKELHHSMFLDVTGQDPRRACCEQMIAALGNVGPILVYNQAFEMGRIAEMAELFPDLGPSLSAINKRIVDLLPIARENYYHPDMKGSWSIKAVLPTIAPELRYDSMLVGDGGDAQDAYREILDPHTRNDRRKELTDGLLEYCKLDTYAMVVLAHFLQGE